MQVGFWKDLLQLLLRLCLGEDDWNEAARQKALQQTRKGANRDDRRVGKLQRLRVRKASLVSFAQGAYTEAAPALGAYTEAAPARRLEQPGGWRLASTRKTSRAPAAARGIRKGQTRLLQLEWLP